MGQISRSQRDITYQQLNVITDRFADFKLCENHSSVERNMCHMLKVIRSDGPKIKIYIIQVRSLAEVNSPMVEAFRQRATDRWLRAWRHQPEQPAASRLKVEVRVKPPSVLYIADFFICTAKKTHTASRYYERSTVQYNKIHHDTILFY